MRLAVRFVPDPAWQTSGLSDGAEMAPDQAEDEGHHDRQGEDALAQAHLLEGSNLGEGGGLDELSQASLNLGGGGSDCRAFGAVALNGASMTDGTWFFLGDVTILVVMPGIIPVSEALQGS